MTAIEPESATAELSEPGRSPAELMELAGAHLAGEFRLIAHLGNGAWGERFAAEDLHRAEEVVLTLLPPIEGEEWKEEERFLEALRAASLLDHPHLAPVRAYGVSGPLRWFAALSNGDPTLAERIADAGPLPMPMVRRIAQQLASGLDQAHRRALTHGALSVHDVRIDANGWVRLEEVGVGAALESIPDPSADQAGLAELVRYCLTGGVEDAPLPAEVDGAVFAAIARATRPRASDRFRDLLEFVAALDGVATTVQPLRPSIPVGKRIRPVDWEELIDTEPNAPVPTRRPLLLRGVAGLGLLLLVTAAIPLGRRLARSEDGKISYPSPPLFAPSVESIAPEPPPLARAEPAPVPSTPTRAPAPSPRPAATRVSAPTLPVAPLQTSALPPVPAQLADEVPGALSISSTPWGELSIDGAPMGNTPQVSVPLAPGHHHLRVARDGFVPFEIDLIVRPGETIRLTQLALKELKL